jgi:hypothetical protein
MVWPLSREQVVSLSRSSYVSLSILLTGRGEGGEGVGAKSYPREKALPSINNSVLSARDTLDDVPLVPPMVFYPETGPPKGGLTAGSLSVVDSESLPDPFKKPAPWPLTPRPSHTPVKANNFEFTPVDNTGCLSHILSPTEILRNSFEFC